MFIARRFKSLLSSDQDRLTQRPPVSGSANLVDDVGIDPTESTSRELNDLPVMDPITGEDWERCLVSESRGLEPEDQTTFHAACDSPDFFSETSLELDRGREATALSDLLEVSTEEECVAPQAEERDLKKFFNIAIECKKLHSGARENSSKPWQSWIVGSIRVIHPCPLSFEI